MGFLGFGKGKSVNAETQGDDTGTEASSQVTTNEGVEDGEGGLLSKFFTFGSQQPFEATDYSDTYAKAKGYFLRFKHIPSGLTLSFKGFITNLQDDFTSNWKKGRDLYLPEHNETNVCQFCCPSIQCRRRSLQFN